MQGYFYCEPLPMDGIEEKYFKVDDKK